MDPALAFGGVLGALALAVAALALRAWISAQMRGLGTSFLELPILGRPALRWRRIREDLGLPEGEESRRAGASLLLLFVALPAFPLQPLLGLLALLAAALPLLSLEKAWARRNLDLERDLPWTLDFLAMGVRAGLDFEVALERAARRRPGPLASDIQLLLSRTRMGIPRRLALSEWGGRSGLQSVRALAGALGQAEAAGNSLGAVLRVQADAARTSRLQRAELSAQKAPVKMLFPLVFCIFPVTFLILFAPLLMSVASEMP